MKISKISLAFRFLTGGYSGVVCYLLDRFNEAIASLPKDRMARASEIAVGVAKCLRIVSELFVPAKYRAACDRTVIALEEFAKALEDGHLSEDELNAAKDEVAAAVKAWKAVG